MKCLSLLACEKVIIDKDGAHSLINVMIKALVQAQTGQPPKDIEISSNAVMPITWWIYTLWNPSLDDIGKVFEQVYQVFWPNGDKLLESSISFTQKDETILQTTFHIIGLPVGQQGIVRIVTWLHLEGQRVSEMPETYIHITHDSEADDGPIAALSGKVKKS